MKKGITTMTALLIAVLSFAQITEKQVTNGGYGKFKTAPKRVFINSFNVYFQVYGAASASTVGGPSLGGSGSTNVSMGVMLDGVDSDDFMKITNQVYNAYVADLKKNGFEIITADEAGKTETYSEWKKMEGGGLNQAQAGGFIKVTPQNYAYFIKRETAKGKEKKGFFGAPLAKLSQDLGDAIIADVNFTYYFVDIKTSSSELVNYASVKAKPKFFFARTTPGDPNSMSFCGVQYSYGKKLSAPAAQLDHFVKKEIYSDKQVFDPKQKLRVFEAGAQKPTYSSYVFGTKTVASHTLSCDPALYKSETERMMAEVLGISVKRLSGAFK